MSETSDLSGFSRMPARRVRICIMALFSGVSVTGAVGREIEGIDPFAGPPGGIAGGLDHGGHYLCEIEIPEAAFLAYRFYGVDDRRGRGVLHGFVGNDVFHSVFTDENRGTVDISAGTG